jgi:tetratricopeptide (TPR) repeat protein
VKQGNRAEAVRWLREVLALDPRRRDVARMIRDLRFEETQVRDGWVRRSRVALVACLAVAVVALLIGRERQISGEIASLPPARPGDLLSTQERLAALQEVFDANMVWATMWSAGRERTALKTEAERLAAAEAAAKARLAEARARARILADAELAQARVAADRFEFDSAQTHFEQALRLAPQGWEARGQVEREIALLKEWKRDEQTALKAGDR